LIFLVFGRPLISTTARACQSLLTPKASRTDWTENEMISSKKQTNRDIKSAKVTIHAGAPARAAFSFAILN
jgi:hypothetical protein